MSEQDPEPEMLTSGEIAEMFGVKPGTAYRWARSGKIPAVRTPGGQYRYPAAAARALLEGNNTSQVEEG